MSFHRVRRDQIRPLHGAVNKDREGAPHGEKIAVPFSVQTDYSSNSCKLCHLV